ncbi:MAG: rod shape-determining protein MreC [Firmicutes bacterium]|nr:rod shape-determining protein MreC [Bacillota bacterium]
MRKKKRKWPKILAMTLIVSLLTGSVALVLVEKFSPDQTYLPQRLVRLPSTVVSMAITPLQGVFAWAARGVSGYLANLKLSKNIEIEYNKLKVQNDELMIQALRVEELEAEVERMRALSDVAPEYRAMNPVVAQVTGKETGIWFQQFEINVGSRHGVKPYMAVVNAQGLIGYTTTVNETSAQVLSIIDSRASIAAVIQSSRDQGEIKGTLGLESEATCRMYYLPVDRMARPNELVVTSGIGMPFPKGIRIGVVRESTRYLDQNKHYVVIEPFVDFMHIEEVLVLVYEPAPEDMPDMDDGQISITIKPMDTLRPIPVIGDEISDPQLGAFTPPPRATRLPAADAEGMPDDAWPQITFVPMFTLQPGATPTTNPELDALIAEELAREQAQARGDN